MEMPLFLNCTSQAFYRKLYIHICCEFSLQCLEGNYRVRPLLSWNGPKINTQFVGNDTPVASVPTLPILKVYFVRLIAMAFETSVMACQDIQYLQMLKILARLAWKYQYLFKSHSPLFIVIQWINGQHPLMLGVNTKTLAVNHIDQPWQSP